MIESIKYHVVVERPAGKFTTYKVISHELDNYCLVLKFGRLEKSLAVNEMAIPIFGIECFYTEDIDEEA